MLRLVAVYLAFPVLVGLGWDNSQSEQLRGFHGGYTGMHSAALRQVGAGVATQKHLLSATAFDCCLA